MELQYELQKTKSELKSITSSRDIWRALVFVLLFVGWFNYIHPTDISNESPECEPTAYYPC